MNYPQGHALRAAIRAALEHARSIDAMRRAQSTPHDREGALHALAELHERVARAARRLARKHELRCARGCHACCIDGLTVFEIEAELIRRHHSDLLEQGEPHPVGACAFLAEDGSCRIYEHRPYVCRTQGLPLRWLEELEDGELVELRDICPLNDRGQPLEGLPAGDCWTIGPVEGKLAKLQLIFGQGKMNRVALRELFARKGKAAT